MNMKSSSKEVNSIQEAFDKIFAFESEADKNEADAHLLMAKFLSKLQEVTDEKHINRKELANLIGTSASYLTQLFRGQKSLNFSTLAKLQNALNIEFEISLKGEAKKTPHFSELDIESFLNKWYQDNDGKGYTKIWKNSKPLSYPTTSENEQPYKPTIESHNLAS